MDSFSGIHSNYTSAAPLELFRFFRENMLDSASAAMTMAIALWWSWSAWRQSSPDQRESSSELTDIVILGTMAGIGFAATGIYLGGADARYFLHPAQWTALAVIAGLIASGIKDSMPARFVARNTWCFFMIAIAVASLGAVQVLKISFNINSTISTARTMIYALRKDNIEQYTSLDRVFLRLWITNFSNWNLFDDRVLAALATTPGGKLKVLASRFASGDRKGKAVLVTPEQYDRWRKEFEVTPYVQTFAPPLPRQCPEVYFVQALTGLPLILGAPPKYPDCSDYIWGRHGKEDELRTREMDRAELCRFAADRNLNAILVLRDLFRTEKNEIVDCKKP